MSLDQDSIAIITALEVGLQHNLTPEELPHEQCWAAAAEFVETIGRMLAVLEQPSAAKGAALLYLVHKLGLDKAGEQSAKIMVTLVESMKVVAANMRDAKAGRVTTEVS